MTYTNSIPVSGDSLGSTRDRIRVNFEQIAIVEAINHVAFDSLGEGKHKFLQMPGVTASGAGVPGTVADEAGFYSDVGTSPAEANLFFRGESNGLSYQLTRADQTNNATFATNTVALGSANGFGGWTFIAGNLLIQYGSFNPNTSTTVSFPIAFTSTPFSVQLTLSSDNNSTHRVGISTGTLTNSQFVFEGSVNVHSNPIYFLAIGS